MPNETRILIGYWNDNGNNYPQYPMPVTEPLLSSKMCELHERVAAYLDSGDIVNQYRGFSACRIDGHGNGTHERCDDKYIWPAGLSHYVRDHHIVLPQEFIDHIVANGYMVPLSRHGSVVTANNIFWVTWALTGIAPTPAPPNTMHKEQLSAAVQEVAAEIDKDVLANLRRYKTNPSPEISKLIDSICNPNNHMLDDRKYHNDEGDNNA